MDGTADDGTCRQAPPETVYFRANRAGRRGEDIHSRRGAAPIRGYADKEQLLEYSCVLNKGEHIQGWESMLSS